jgi:uncharacterized membrane protein YgcG/chromosome segregation ATPase
VKNALRLFALLIWLLLLAAPALAQGRVIVDDTTGRVDQAAVTQAAQALVRKNATVMVLVSDQTGSDPQTYASQRLATYNIRANPLDPTAIVYLVALDRRNVFIYYGADWNATLGPTYKNIADQNMIPQLARGNITQGVTAGIQGTVDAIDNPPGRGPNLTPIAIAIVVAVLIFVGIPLLVRSIGKRRSAAQALANARQAAEDARKRAGAAIADMGQALKDAQEKAKYDQISYPPAEVQQIGQWQRAAEGQFVSAQERFDAAGEALAGQRAPAQAEYEANAQAYDQVAQLVEAARAQLAQAEARRAELDKLNDQAPGEVDRAKKALADAAARLESLGQDFARPQEILRPAADLVAQAEAQLSEHRAADAIASAGAASAAIDELAAKLTTYADIREGISAGRAAAERVAAQGYRIEAGLAAFDAAEATLRQAAAALERDPGSTSQLLAQAESQRTEGVARGGGMPALREANAARLDATKQAGEQIDTEIAAGRDAFKLVNEFAETTWSDIRGNGSESEEAAARARQLWERATTRNSMEQQDFLGAKQDLDAADERIGYAHTLIESILQRLKDLQAARDAARQEIAAAQADIDQGWAYVRSNDPDIGKNPERDLGQAAALIEQANAELRQDRPNWLTIVKQAQEANRLADQAIANARSEVEAMAKLREQAQRAQQLAAAEVQKIVQFVGLHKGDIPAASEQRLGKLQGQIQQAYAALQAAERDEEEARAADLRAAVTRYAAIEHDAEALYAEIYAAFQRIDELRKQVAGRVELAERAIAQAEQRIQTYAQLIRPSAEATRLIEEARAELDGIGAPHDERGLQHAIQQADAARSAAERADQLITSQARQMQRSDNDMGDFLGGVIVGSLLNSGHGGQHGGHHGGGSGWSSGGGSMGGWGGGGGGGWSGGGGGGGGWGGGGGGGSGW